MLISAIMPTTGARRDFIPGAVACFLEQTWKEKELIVVDDGPAPVIDLVIDIPGIVYLRFPPRMKLGRKRNIACEHAAGTVIMHWDDDDWYAPARMQDGVERLLKSGKGVFGFHSAAFWDDSRQKAFRYEERPGQCAVGSSLCYLKDYWERHRFPSEDRGEDNYMIYRARDARELATAPDRGLMVARIHPGNTSVKEATGIDPKTRLATGSSSWPEVPRADLPAAFFACA